MKGGFLFLASLTYKKGACRVNQYDKVLRKSGKYAQMSKIFITFAAV